MITQSKQQISAALTAMSEDLLKVKATAEEMQEEIQEISPDDLAVDLTDEIGDLDLSEEEKEEMPKVETSEDAKKVLDEATKDIQKVIDSIDGLVGQADEEIEATAFRRQNTASQKNISILANQAKAAIDDGNNALKYWNFLRAVAKHKSTDKLVASVSDNGLRNTLKAVKEAKTAWSFLNGLFSGKKVEATAVPPTGAEFSGDKFPSKGDSAEKELKNWHDGAAKFKKDKKFEDARPNAATDQRLTDIEYNHDEKPYVNASFVDVPGNRFGSYWKVSDTKSGKEFKVSFASAPSSLGPKNEKGFTIFASKGYGKKLIKAIMDKGIAATAAYMNGNLSGKITATASDKSIQTYYADAMGDKAFAKAMVADNKPKAAGDGTAYTPKDKTVKDADFHVKDGTGTLASKDPAVIKARARSAVKVARHYAAIGAIPFTKEAIYAKSSELMKVSNDQFSVIEATLKDLPITNQAALVEAHIPDTETGIVGNAATGVRDPKGSVDSGSIQNNVDSDAKVASKTASFIPQTLNDGTAGLRVAPKFTTTEQKLQDKGVDLSKVRKATYKSF